MKECGGGGGGGGWVEKVERVREGCGWCRSRALWES